MQRRRSGLGGSGALDTCRSFEMMSDAGHRRNGNGFVCGSWDLIRRMLSK
jgi:hypothetical protein